MIQLLIGGRNFFFLFVNLLYTYGSFSVYQLLRPDMKNFKIYIEIENK